MKTYSVKKKDIERKWHIIDATDMILGHLATKVATLIMGKHKPMFTRNMDTGDYVVVINASKVRFSGNKEKNKLYYRHSTYPGGLKVVTLEEMMKTKPTWVIERSVKGMIPHNRLGASMLKKLKVYADDNHPHIAQTGNPVIE